MADSDGRGVAAGPGGRDLGESTLIGRLDFSIPMPKGGVVVRSVVSPAALDAALRPLAEAIAMAPAEVRPAAEAGLAALRYEAAKGKDADDGAMARLVDGLVCQVPGTATPATMAFTEPVLAGLAGPVTRFVLDKLRAA